MQLMIAKAENLTLDQILMMSQCNCHGICKLKAEAELTGVIIAKNVIKSEFFQYWAESKTQNEAVLAAIVTDKFLENVELDLRKARRNYINAFANPFRAIELY